MSKLGAIVTMCVLMGIGITISTFTVPILHDFALSTNATLAATSNMSNYPGTSEALVTIPWVMYIMYPFIGLIAIVLILKGDSIKRAISNRFGG